MPSELTSWNAGSWDEAVLGWMGDRSSHWNSGDHVAVRFNMRESNGATDNDVAVQLSVRRGDLTGLTSFLVVPKPDPADDLALSLRYTPAQVSYEWRNLSHGVVLASDEIIDASSIPLPEEIPYLFTEQFDAGGGIFTDLPPTYLDWGNQPGNGGCRWKIDHWFARAYAEDEPFWSAFHGQQCDWTTPVPEPPLPLPVCRLLGATPNPFREQTAVHFGLVEPVAVEIVVFDPAGRRVRRLLAGGMPAVEHTVTWDGRNQTGEKVPSGIYFVRVGVEGTRQSLPLIHID